MFTAHIERVCACRNIFVKKTDRESSDEHGNSDLLTFWCGETYGMIDAFHAGSLGFKGGKTGAPFFVAVSFSADKRCYIGEWCFSKLQYELDEQLKSKLIHISYEEYEKKAKFFNVKSKGERR